MNDSGNITWSWILVTGCNMFLDLTRGEFQNIQHQVSSIRHRRRKNGCFSSIRQKALKELIQRFCFHWIFFGSNKNLTQSLQSINKCGLLSTFKMLVRSGPNRFSNKITTGKKICHPRHCYWFFWFFPASPIIRAAAGPLQRPAG